MHYPAMVVLLVAATPLLGVVVGVVGALLWRRRTILRGHHVTPRRSIIGVFNGVAIGLVAGITIYLILAVTLPPLA